MRFYKYLIYKDLFSKSYSEIDNLMYECARSYKDNEFCKICHDEAIRQLSYDEYFVERYEGESNDIAYFISELCYVRLCNEWKYEVVHWISYIRRNEVRYKNAFRYLDYSEEKFYAYVEDTELDYTIKLASGLIEQVSDKVIRKYSPTELLNLTMNKCKYVKDDSRYKYLEMSLMLSVVRNKLIIYNISDMDRNHLIYLINTYKVLERKLVVESDNKF